MHAFPWTSPWGGYCLKKSLMEFKVSHYQVICMKNAAFVVSKNHCYLICVIIMNMVQISHGVLISCNYKQTGKE